MTRAIRAISLKPIKLAHIKSIIIWALALLMVYQTGVLWLVSITSRTFLFNYLPFMHQTAIPDGADSLVSPWRIITEHGDGRFSVQYSDLAASESRRYGDKVLSHLFQSGAYVAAHRLLNMDDFRLAYIYEYAFPMEAEWFTHGFGQRNNLLTSRITAPFRQVVILPPLSGIEDAAVFFIAENGYAYEFSVTPPTVGGFDTVIPEEATGAYYIWVGQQLNKFIRHGNFTFSGVRRINPYEDRGNLFIRSIQDGISVFFSNPLGINYHTEGDVWRFNDANIVVRYYDTHVLELINYRSVDRNAPQTFLNDYTAAARFLAADHLINNETYLAGFREEEGKHIFYFNYVINNTPMIMQPNWPRGVNMPHPIIITVDHGTVVHYRKIAFNFEAKQERSTASANFVNPENHEFILLGYRMGDRDVEATHWLADGRILPVPILR